MTAERSRVLILGAGLAGLSAGLALTRAGVSASVLERAPTVGGLARTVARGAFRFDLGGHRFYTKDGRVEAFVRDLMGRELETVRRRSQILLGRRSIDYPLRPLNAIGGLGTRAAARVLVDYARQRVKHRLRPSPIVSLEDWVVRRFGRALFEVYFKGYSEKVWGLDCRRISMEWLEQRIQGLSLGLAVRHALLGRAGGAAATLAEAFLYPPLGIGRIAERLREEIERENRVFTSTVVRRVEHTPTRVTRLLATQGGRARVFEGEDVVSAIPLTALIGLLHPRAPDDVREAASRLRYRDLVIVTVLVDRPRITDQTWIYVPDRAVPFSRIHEPTNWSAGMAPKGQTLLVTEHFCFSGDGTWSAPDDALIEVTIAHLVRLGLLARREVIDGVVVRVPGAYPLFEVGYREPYDRVRAYLARFENLELTGRSGTFTYLNMDHAIASGLRAAGAILARTGGAPAAVPAAPALAATGA